MKWESLHLTAVLVARIQSSSFSNSTLASIKFTTKESSIKRLSSFKAIGVMMKEAIKAGLE
jgi:hypothetical protein